MSLHGPTVTPALKVLESCSNPQELSSTIAWGAMQLVSQPRTAGFRPVSKDEYIVPRQQMC